MGWWGDVGGSGSQLPNDTPLPNNQKFVFNEIFGAPKGVESEIISFTSLLGKNTHLMTIRCGGTVIGEYSIYVNNVLVDKTYIWYGSRLEALFDYRRSDAGGIYIAPSSIVSVRVLADHPRVTTGDFFCRINYLEVN